jgi:hypothetical protein
MSMHTARPVRKVGVTAALLVTGMLLAQYASPASSSAKPLSAPIFTSKAAAKAKANVPFAFTVKTKGNPIPAISAVGTLPAGIGLHDNANGTATLAGTEALGGTYTIGLRATNGIGAPVGQSLTLTVKSKLPPVRHVFVIMLENTGYAATFGSPANDPYLATTLPSQGALLEKYYGTGHFSNDNYVGFVSGQPSNASNQLDCGTYSEFTAGQDAQGIQQGTGCVYPSAVKTVADQLSAAGFSWKGYLEDMGNDPSRESTVCAHPVLGGSDPSFTAESGDGYATRHNPFVYFHSIIDDPSVCNQQVVPLGTTGGGLPSGTPAGVTGLATDLQSIATTPNFSFISPNLCNDGHDYPCKNVTSPSTSAVGDVDAFLRMWVPLITSSPAFQKDGLLEITFDEAEQPTLDSTACCGETAGPAASGGLNGLTGPGGGRVGAVVLSPFFGLPRLGEAKTITTTFAKGVYTK